MVPLKTWGIPPRKFAPEGAGGLNHPRHERMIVAETTLVAGGGEVGHPGTNNFIYSLGNKAILEHRLGQVYPVIDDDLGPSIAQSSECCSAKARHDLHCAVANAKPEPGATSWMI